MPRRLWGPVAIGFCGIVLILKPGLALFQPAALVGVLAALFAAVAQVGVASSRRRSPRCASSSTSALSPPRRRRPGRARAADAPAVRVAVLARWAARHPGPDLPDPRLRARAGGPRGPFIYSSVVFAGLLEWALWTSVPDALSLPACPWWPRRACWRCASAPPAEAGAPPPESRPLRPRPLARRQALLLGQRVARALELPLQLVEEPLPSPPAPPRRGPPSARRAPSSRGRRGWRRRRGACARRAATPRGRPRARRCRSSVSAFALSRKNRPSSSSTKSGGVMATSSATMSQSTGLAGRGLVARPRAGGVRGGGGHPAARAPWPAARG